MSRTSKSHSKVRRLTNKSSDLTITLVINTCTETTENWSAHLWVWNCLSFFFHRQPTESAWWHCKVACECIHHTKVTQRTAAHPAYEILVIRSPAMFPPSSSSQASRQPEQYCHVRTKFPSPWIYQKRDCKVALDFSNTRGNKQVTRRMRANCFSLKSFLPFPEWSLHPASLGVYKAPERRPEILPLCF